MNKVFNIFSDFSKKVHKEDRIRVLNERIRKLGITCECCDNWLKTKGCPKENGKIKGPSANTPKCSSFIQSNYSKELLSKIIAEIETEKSS